MFNRFARWVTGTRPDRVGVYWAADALCVVSLCEQPDGMSMVEHCMYESGAMGNQAERLALALKQIGKADAGLCMAIPADEVIVRSMIVPAGLSDQQVAQIATVEAVVNLPVPPEEICLDFLRLEPGRSENSEEVRIAFCRREKIDLLLGSAEEVGVSVEVIDRDVQAIHDVVTLYLHNALGAKEIQYPFAIVLAEADPRVLFCFGPIEMNSYLIRPESADVDPARWCETLVEQVSLSWTRTKMGLSTESEPLSRVIYLGELAKGMREAVDVLSASVMDCPMLWLPPLGGLPCGLDVALDVPVEASVIALGMALRGRRDATI